VTLGAYTLKSFDTNGKWYIWQKRDDWKRTTVARFGEPGPKYVAYIDPGPPDKRVIAQLNHELDIIHDVSPEGMFTLAKQQFSHGWFKGFPYAHPDPTLPAVVLNAENDMFKSRDVRWALALLIDIKAVSMASYRGAATISAIAVPPTGSAPEVYHAPLESWLQAFEIDTGKRKVKPYDPTVGKQIADMLRPSLKDQIPSDPRDRQVVRPRLVEAQPAGGSRAARARRLQQEGRQVVDARRQAVRHQDHGRGRGPPVMTRAGSMIAQQWRQFGIDAATVVAQGSMFDRRAAGDYEAMITWSVETWGGHPDLSFFLDSWHSQFVARPASRSRRATGSAGAIPSSTRSSSRCARPASTIPRASSSAASSSSSRCARCRSSR
jgi:peptide/nickel transport system substrate-binding protein